MCVLLCQQYVVMCVDDARSVGALFDVLLAVELVRRHEYVSGLVRVNFVGTIPCSRASNYRISTFNFDVHVRSVGDGFAR